MGQVYGSGVRLQHVFCNLLSNAIKFIPQGGNVEVRLERIGTEAKIQVSDTVQGIGASKTTIRFRHIPLSADNVITRFEGGLGLGLAIVKQRL